MLTADAFGILPPIARLTRDQALFYFLSGFTAKLAGTEIGVTEPQPTFSTCFGAPFLPQPPAVYARMLGEKLDAHGADGLARQHRAGRAARTAKGTGCRSRRPRPCSTPLSSGELDDGRVPHRRGLRLRRAGRRSGRRSVAARPALDLERSRRLRREGARAGVACSGRTSRRVRRRCRCGRRGRRASRVSARELRVAVAAI